MTSSYCAPCIADLALVREAVTAVSGTATCMAHAVLLTHSTDDPGRRRQRLDALRDLATGKAETAEPSEQVKLELLVQEYGLAGAMDMGGPSRRQERLVRGGHGAQGHGGASHGGSGAGGQERGERGGPGAPAEERRPKSRRGRGRGEGGPAGAGQPQGGEPRRERRAGAPGGGEAQTAPVTPAPGPAGESASTPIVPANIPESAGPLPAVGGPVADGAPGAESSTSDAGGAAVTGGASDVPSTAPVAAAGAGASPVPEAAQGLASATAAPRESAAGSGASSGGDGSGPGQAYEAPAPTDAGGVAVPPTAAPDAESTT